MFPISEKTDLTKTTSHKVVLPFYVYAAISFLVAVIFLFISSTTLITNYFHPHILAITHIVALGWGTMIILGVSHHLIPTIIGEKLYSNKLAYTTFILAAIGIPLLAYGFYVSNMGNPAKWGGRFVVLAILAYLINLGKSINKKNIQSVYIYTATMWLFITTFFGLILVYNFTYKLLDNGSAHYLPLHVHAGVIGWFLLLVIGVASRLIPMYLISKYTNDKLLWIIYFLINFSIISYISIFYFFNKRTFIFISSIALFTAIILFIYYCYCVYKNRLRKSIDEQMKLSLLSTAMIVLPILILFVILAVITNTDKISNSLIATYGFLIFFGWITAIILGMTFKTLPFIVWNKIYQNRSTNKTTHTPKDLFNNSIFKLMSVFYLLGFILFLIGILVTQSILLQIGAALLILCAILYNFNVFTILNHKAISL